MTSDTQSGQRQSESCLFFAPKGPQRVAGGQRVRERSPRKADAWITLIFRRLRRSQKNLLSPRQPQTTSNTHPSHRELIKHVNLVQSCKSCLKTLLTKRSDKHYNPPRSNHHIFTIAAIPNPTDLNNLHDIITPPPVPAWPPAPGWCILAALILTLTAIILYQYLKNLTANRYRRQALRQLAQVQPSLSQPATRQEALTLIAATIRQTAITAFGRDKVACLTGQPWLDFLNAASPDSPFVDNTGHLLVSGPYNPNLAAQSSQEDLNTLYNTAQAWILRHRPLKDGGSPC